jgi:hypothetical protein
MSGFILTIVAGTWIYLANHARKSNNLVKLKEEYLNAQINTLNAYNHSILINISDSLKDSLEAKSQMSELYVKAKNQEVQAWSYYKSASRVLRADM